MSRRCRRIRAMKILVESVETGSAHVSGFEQKNRVGSPLDPRGRSRHADRRSHQRNAVGGRSSSLPPPTRGFRLLPAKSRRPSRSSALSSHRARTDGPVADALTGRKGRSSSAGSDRALPAKLPNSSSFPSPLTLSHTMYRTIHFDNLRWLGNLGHIGNLRRLGITKILRIVGCD